ncbi:MAG: kinetochore protein SPC24 [Ardenticatenaceae bacterium]|nr:kinetochore protein SPC24 [Ardenticatenaceae bacterium]HBY97780.1 hypothetical protein [Chloroflexota bacterium]
MAPRTKLFTEHVFPLRPVRSLPRVSLITRDMARRGLLLLTLIGLILFLYLAEISQVSTTEIEIENLRQTYTNLQEQNQELEREIAELEGPARVLNDATKNGLRPGAPVYLDLQP